MKRGNILSETHNDAESDDDDSIMPPILSEEEMDAMDSGDDSDHDLISTDILEDICDGSQSHPNVNQRESRYKIRDCINQRKEEWKVASKATQSMVKVYTRYLRLL